MIRFQEFIKNERKAYAFLMVLTVIFLFGLVSRLAINSYSSLKIENELLKRENKILQNKTYELNIKLLKIIENESIFRNDDSHSNSGCNQ